MSRFKTYAVNKPFNILTGFSPAESHCNLHQLGSFPKDVYPVGRLDKDSEGLLILSNDNTLNHKLLHPSRAKNKVYYVQVEGDITEDAVKKLKAGVEIAIKGSKYFVKAQEAKPISNPGWIWERNPPIRERKNIPTSWVALTLNEGKNRQVRRMTAAVGFPTLRLIRYSIGNLSLEDLDFEKVTELNPEQLRKLIAV